MSELLLGIDIGTSSSKGVLATLEGEIVAATERPHELSLPRPGWAEHDAEDVWWADFTALCGELAGGARGDIAGVCVSGIGPCLLPVDRDGAPLRPAILYGIDTRASAEIDELTERLGLDAILKRCGSPLTSQAVGPKLLWLRRNEPDVWERTDRFVMASSFVVERLSGEFVLDHHSASQCDPLYDLGDSAWIDQWAEDIAPGLRLPRLVWPGEVAGRVTDDGAAATGIRAGTPVAAGTIDAWAEAASVGVRHPGDLMLMYGTTMFLIAVLAEVPVSERLWSTAGVFSGTRNLAAGMATSGALTSWLRELVGGPSYESLIKDAAVVPRGSEGLLVLPYFAGERTPLFDPAARGVICGLTLNHGRGHIYRALLEATAFGVRHNLAAMAEAGARIDRIVAVGGGTKGDLWTQIVSDVTGRSQEVPQQTIGAAYGDAWLAGVATGQVEPGSNWNPIASVVRPDPDAAPVYERLYELYLRLHTSTRDISHVLAEMQSDG
jgi:xylulokinase